uniref:Uncharacterized protein n=1 Tax=Meloidogyne enterolobii TaxID=390850 RepID=A0A6V7UP91_MELEN|nr:unnamed protein product [Meloidogyne enterolobii]
METSEPQVEQQISSPLKEVRPKRKSKPKRYMTFTGTESRLDFLINKKMQAIEKTYEIEDDEYDINDEQGIKLIEYRDKLLSKAFDMECEQRNYAEFEDAEVDSIVDCVSSSPNPIFIYDTDLEPLDQMLTTFVNTPGGLLSDYLIPEFEDVKDFLEHIRNEGDCPLYDRFVPKVDTEEYSDYILKILRNVREKIQLHRSINFRQMYDVKQTEGGQVINGESKDSLTPLDKFAEKLATMKSEGQIVKEEEPSQDDVDDLEILEIFTKSASPSEASHYNDALQPTTSKEATDIDLEIIALDKDVENANVGSCANVGDNNMDCVSDSEASAASSKKSDDSIAVGESAISPIASPKKQEVNEVKMKDYEEEEDDDIICID